MKFVNVLLFLLFSLCLFAEVEWDEDLMMFETDNPVWKRTTATLDDGIVYAWCNNKSGYYDIYAQKFDENGLPQWNDGEPIIISQKPITQNGPELVVTSDSNLIVSWNECENMNPDFTTYVQKIDTNGNILWEESGIEISSFGHYGSSFFKMQAKENGSVYISKSGRNVLNCVLIDNSGEITWSQNYDSEVCFGDNGIIKPVDIDETGVIILFNKSGYGDDYLSFCKLNFDASLEWEILLEPDVTNYYAKAIKTEEDNYIVSWFTDSLKLQKISNTGEMLWEEPLITDITNNIYDFATNHAGGFYLSYLADNNLYLAEYSQVGELISEDLISENVATFLDYPISLFSHNNQNLAIIWQSSRQLFMQLLDNEGNALMGSSGEIIFTNNFYSEPYSIDYFADKFVLASTHRQQISDTFRHQFIDNSGEILLTDNETTIYQSQMNNSTYFGFVNTDEDNYVYSLYRYSSLFQKFSDEGELYFENDEVSLIDTLNYFFYNEFVAIKHHQSGLAFACRKHFGDTSRIKYYHLDAEGNFEPENGVFVTSEYELDQMNPFISEVNGEYYIFWHDMEQDWCVNIYAQKIVNGERQWGERGVPIQMAELGAGDANILDVEDNYIICQSGFNGPVKIKRINPDGTMINEFGEDGLEPYQFQFTYLFPSDGHLYSKSNDEKIALCSFLINGEVRLFAQLVNESAEILWQENGVELFPEHSEIEDYQAVVVDDGFIVAAECRADDQYYLVLNKYNFNGEPNWEEHIVTMGYHFTGKLSLEVFSGNIMLTYTYNNHPEHFIYTQMFDANGSIITENDSPILINSSNLAVEDIEIFKLDEDSAIIGWLDPRPSYIDPKDSEYDYLYQVFAQKIIISNVNNDEVTITPVNNFSNFPNPFNPTTTISYALPQSGQTEITIYNLKGQKVKTLVNQEMEKGNHQVQWNGTDEAENKVSSGVYFYKLKIDGQTEAVNKCLMLK